MKLLTRWFVAIVAVWVLTFVFVAKAQAQVKTQEQKLHEISWVVYCEDNTDLKASKLVLSTIYNRAKSHDVDRLHKEITRPRQYYCHRIAATKKKLSSARFKQIRSMVNDFVQYRQSPTTKAKYFYNHKQVSRERLGKMKLTVAQVYGAHTYLY